MDIERVEKKLIEEHKGSDFHIGLFIEALKKEEEFLDRLAKARGMTREQYDDIGFINADEPGEEEQKEQEQLYKTLEETAGDLYAEGSRIQEVIGFCMDDPLGEP